MWASHSEGPHKVICMRAKGWRLERASPVDSNILAQQQHPIQRHVHPLEPFPHHTLHSQNMFVCSELQATAL